MITYVYDKPVRLKGKSVDLSERGFLFLRSLEGLGIDLAVRFPVVPSIAIRVGDSFGSELEFSQLANDLSCWPEYGMEYLVPQLVFLNATNLLRYVSRSVEQGLLGTVTKRLSLDLDFVPSMRDIVRMTDRVKFNYPMDCSCIVIGFGLLWQCSARFSWDIIKKFFGGYRAGLILEDSS